MRQPIFRWAAAIIAAGTILAGCGQPASAPQGEQSRGEGGATTDFSQASGTIVWAAPPITHTGLRQSFIKKFEETHPKIKVVLQDQPNDSDTNRASLTTAIGGGASTPDLYMADVIWPAQFANAGLAMALDEKLPSSFFQRFSPGLIEGATYKGHIYGAPFFADSSFLFYRKDLLDQAGLPVPTSWEQVQQEAKELQSKGLVKYGFVWQGAGYEGLTCDFMEFLTDAGGKVFDDQGHPAIDSPQATKALSFMRDLITSGVSPQAEVTFKENESMNVFNNGDAAFLRNWTYAWKNSQSPANSKVVGKVGVVALPSFGGPNGYSTVGGWNLMVNPHTKNPEAVLAFIDWATGPEGQTILAKDFGELPTNATVANDPSIQKVNPVFAEVKKLRYISRPSQTPNYPAVSQAIYTHVNQVLAGGLSVDQALKQMQQAIQSAAGSGGL